MLHYIVNRLLVCILKARMRLTLVAEQQYSLANIRRHNADSFWLARSWLPRHISVTFKGSQLG